MPNLRRPWCTGARNLKPQHAVDGITFRVIPYRYDMIQSFKDVRAGKLMSGQRVVELVNIQQQARTRLIRLDSATSLEDLRALRGNGLEAQRGAGRPVLRGSSEALSGRRKGQFSIRINDQFRICFKWKAKGPADVEITDYH